MAKNKYLSSESRQSILVLGNEGYAMREIAKKLKILYNAVYYSLHRTANNGSNRNRKRSGRPRCTIEQEDKYIRVSRLRNRCITSPQLTASLNCTHIFRSMKRHRGCSRCCVAKLTKNRLHAQIGLHLWWMAGRPMHFSYEWVSLCHMELLYDMPRATGGKRAEHRTQRYTAAGNFDCNLHQTSSTVRTPVRKLSGDMGSEHDNVLFHTEAW